MATLRSLYKPSVLPEGKLAMPLINMEAYVQKADFRLEFFEDITPDAPACLQEAFVPLLVYTAATKEQGGELVYEYEPVVVRTGHIHTGEHAHHPSSR